MEHIVASNIVRPRRKSAFLETGLFDDDCRRLPPHKSTRPSLKVRFRSKNDIFEHTPKDDQWEDLVDSDADSETHILTASVVSPTRPTSMSTLIRRLSLVVLILATVIPITHLSAFGGSERPILGATGVPIAEQPEPIFDEVLTKRDDSPTNYCKRWSQQSTSMVLSKLTCTKSDRCIGEWYSLPLWWTKDDVVQPNEQYLGYVWMTAKFSNTLL
jgi:hypothetical protein